MEGCICKLSCKTVAPKQLLDHCIELEGLIHIHTASDINVMGSEVPKTIMKERMANFSQIYKFCWYNLVILNDTVNAFRWQSGP